MCELEGADVELCAKRQVSLVRTATKQTKEQLFRQPRAAFMADSLSAQRGVLADGGAL